MLTLWSGKVSAGPDSGKRKQDDGNLKGPDYKPGIFDGPLHFGFPRLTYDRWGQVLGTQFLTYLEAHFIELVGQQF